MRPACSLTEQSDSRNGGFRQICTFAAPQLNDLTWSIATGNFRESDMVAPHGI